MKTSMKLGLAAIVLTAATGCSGRKATTPEYENVPVIKQVVLYGADPTQRVVYDEFDLNNTDITVSSDGALFCYDKSGDSHYSVYSCAKSKHGVLVSGSFLIENKK